MDLYRWLPPEGVKFVLVLFLSFLIGLEREEHKAGSEHYTFGGVRTFPLIGLIGYAIALLSGGQLLPVTLGFAVVAGFLMLSYWHKLEGSAPAGVTTEMSGLATYLVGALVYHEKFWIATTLSIAGVFLLELKTALENLTKRVPGEEILTFTKFLLLTAVILPVLPNQEFGPFQINPFKAWLVVVAVSAVSYGSYVIGRLTKGGGVVLAAILGGAYSSTVTTLVLARRAARENQPHLFSGATLIASGMMYLRLAVLLALFNWGLFVALGPSFSVLAGLAIGTGWLRSRRSDRDAHEVRREYEPRNPLDLRVAFTFAALFLAMLVATHWAIAHLGKTGVYSLAAIMGVVDVDPFIMGMTQTSASLSLAAGGVLIAASSNNLAKGVYAFVLSDRKTGIQSLGLLIGLSILGLVPLFWFVMY
jgi:uncharacterized membrane protein (DUF4010 family)